MMIWALGHLNRAVIWRKFLYRSVRLIGFNQKVHELFRPWCSYSVWLLTFLGGHVILSDLLGDRGPRPLPCPGPVHGLLRGISYSTLNASSALPREMPSADGQAGSSVNAFVLCGLIGVLAEIRFPLMSQGGLLRACRDRIEFASKL